MSTPENTDDAGSSHPGMMGDGTEEQSLGQSGKKGARITEDEAREAFGGESAAQDDETILPDDQPQFWKGFAWGAGASLAAMCLLRGVRRRLD
jgi:hypothetical protein